MPDVTFQLLFSDDGTLSIVDDAGTKLSNLNQSAENTSSGGIADLTSGVLDLANGVMSAINTVAGAGGFIENLTAIGEASQRATIGLNALSSGKSDEYLAAMRDNAHGLLSEMDMAGLATNALSLGIVNSAEQMGKLTRIGSTLGEVFNGDPVNGVNALEMALERVGNTRALLPLHVDMQAVNDEFKRLKAEGVEKTLAWQTAVMDVAGALSDKLQPALDKGVTAVDRMNASLKDLESRAGEQIAIWVNVGIRDVTQPDAGGNKGIALNQILNGNGMPDIFGPGHSAGDKLMGPFGSGGAGATSSTSGATTNYLDKDETLRDYSGQPAHDVGRYTPASGSTSTPQWGPIAGPNSVGTTPEYQAQQNLIIQQQLSGLISQDTDYFFGQQSALGKITAEFEAQNALLTHRKSITTEAQAFGYKGGDQLQTGATNQLESDIATYNHRHGIKTDTTAEVNAINGIKIAMGEATTESIAFDGVNKRLSDDFLAGKITAQQYADGLNNMNLAAKDGALSAEALSKAIALANNPDGPLSAAHQMNNSEDRGGPSLFAGAKAGGPNTQNDPFLQTKKNADDAHDAIDKMQGLIAGLPDVGNKAFQGLVAQAKNASDFASPIVNGATLANQALGGVVNTLNSIKSGAFSIAVSITQTSGGSSAGGGSGGSGGSLGPTATAI